MVRSCILQKSADASLFVVCTVPNQCLKTYEICANVSEAYIIVGTFWGGAVTNHTLQARTLMCESNEMKAKNNDQLNLN